jgi:DNA-binding transcriptional regulator YhcF (GntR family)
LLQVHDRADGDVLPLTQETLAEFLGVRRTTVTQVISKLRDSGAIRSNARSSIEIDRPRLEAAACECYQLMRRRIDRIVLTEEKKSRPLGYEIPLFANADEVRRRTTTQGVTGQRPRGH